MKFVRDKFKICQTIVPLLQEKNVDITVEQAMKSWWRNPRRSGGLSLTDSGVHSFHLAGLAHYDIEYRPKLFAGGFTLLTTLNKKLQCPYVLQRERGVIYVRVYDSRIVVLVNLLGGLEEYLNSLEE